MEKQTIQSEKAARKEKKQEFLLKEIESNNFVKQNEELVNKGYTYLKRNLKMLRLFKGDVSKVIESYQNQSNFRVERLNKKIVALGLEEKNKQLIEQGYANIHRNFRCLKKTNFDVEQAIERLKSWDKKREDIPDLETKVNELIIKGYNNKRLNQISLNKCNGSINEAIQWLDKKNKRWQLRKQAKQLGGFRRNAKDITFEGKTLYIDGNLLFSNKKLSEIYLKKNRECAERLLEEIAIKFSINKKIKQLILVFSGKNESIISRKSGELKIEKVFTGVENAKNFEYLNNKVKQLSDELDQNIFVIQDIKTIDNIVVNGAKLILKSNNWMKLVKEQIVNEEFQKVLDSLK